MERPTRAPSLPLACSQRSSSIPRSPAYGQTRRGYAVRYFHSRTLFITNFLPNAGSRQIRLVPSINFCPLRLFTFAHDQNGTAIMPAPVDHASWMSLSSAVVNNLSRAFRRMTESRLSGVITYSVPAAKGIDGSMKERSRP